MKVLGGLKMSLGLASQTSCLLLSAPVLGERKWHHTLVPGTWPSAGGECPAWLRCASGGSNG